MGIGYPFMKGAISEMKVLTVVHQDFEDLEFWYPVLRLQEEGITVHVLGEKANETYSGKHGVPAVSDYAFGEVDAADYAGLLIPGGWAPDKLRRFPAVLELVRKMDESGKPIGQICHAGWVLVSAKVLKGRKVTSTTAIRDDMENAGAMWVDEPVVVDGNLISSRKPQDLPVYMKAFIEALASK